MLRAALRILGLSAGALALLSASSNAGEDGGRKAIRRCGADGQTIACGAVVSCRLDPAGDTDLYRFSAPRGERALIRIVGPFPTVWRLFSPTGVPLDSSGGCPGRECGFSDTPALPSNGRYTIETSNNFNNVVNYQLAIQGISSSYRCGDNIRYGATKTGRLAAGAEIDTYHFVGRANQLIGIRIAGPFATVWRLYNPLGELSGVSGGCPGSACGVGQVTLSRNGTYTIAVLSLFGEAVNYNLTLQRIAGPSLGGE
jgi:hypothetical protein